MWIKNQDGGLLINTDLIKLNDKLIVVIPKRNDLRQDICVGIFGTKEKAKKEFENIEFAIINNKNFYEISEDK